MGWLNPLRWFHGNRCRSEPDIPVREPGTPVQEPGIPVRELGIEQGAESGSEPGIPVREPGGEWLRKPCPPPEVQAAALLEWLQARHEPGSILRACDVEQVGYVRVLTEKGWRERPWDGSRGVGTHLVKLPGVRRFLKNWPEKNGQPLLEWPEGACERKRRKSYQLPPAEAATNVVELPKRDAR